MLTAYMQFFEIVNKKGVGALIPDTFIATVLRQIQSRGIGIGS